MDYKDVTVAKISELADGEMKQVSASGAEILLTCVNGKVHAVGAHCTHYGAPLVEGVLSGERVICPWHHACFNARTGDLIEPPAFDALPRYEVKVENDEVIVRVPDGAADRRTPLLTKRDKQDERLFLIAGGGAAGYAEAARDKLVAAGIEVSDFFHLGPNGPAAGLDPERRSYFSLASFSDPDGNSWLLQEITTRFQGRVDPGAISFGSSTDLASAFRRAEVAHGEHEKRTGGQRDENWPDWYAAYMAAEQTGAELPQ